MGRGHLNSNKALEQMHGAPKKRHNLTNQGSPYIGRAPSVWDPRSMSRSLVTLTLGSSKEKATRSCLLVCWKQ